MDRPEQWDPTDLGLAGWSLDLLHRYDAANGITLDGYCSWRSAHTVSVGGGESAVPSFDGRLAYVFDAAGRHVRTVDAILGVDLIRFDYDVDGRLLSAHGAFAGRPIDLTVQRTPDGEITGLIGAGGSTTRVSTDGRGHLGAVTHPDGGTESVIANAEGLVTAYVDRVGGVNRFDYDSSGRLLATTDPDGVTVRYERTASTNAVEVAVSAPLGGKVTYRTRLLDTGTERSYVAPGGPTATIVESLDGQRTVTLPDGTRLTIGASPDARWGSAAPVLTPTVEERPDGVVRRTEIEQAVEPTPGDPLRLASWSRTTTIGGDAYVERYDPTLRTMNLTDPMGRTTTYAYDDQGRVVASSSPGQPSVAFTYDEHGRLMSDTRGSGADAATTTYSYGDDGRVTLTRPDGATEELFVDAAGRVVRQTAGDGSSLLSSYDAAGRAIMVRPGAGQATTLGFSQAGRPTAFVPPALSDDSSYEIFNYDGAGRVTAVAGPGDRAISMAYDDPGRLVEVRFDRGQLDAQYDPVTGRLANVTAPGGIETAYAYVGSLGSGVAWSGPVSGTVGLKRDYLGRVVSETVDDGPAFPFTYDRGGALTGVGSLVLERDGESGLITRVSQGVVEIAFDYDVNGQLVAATASANGTPLDERRYVRDLLGRIATLTEDGRAGPRTVAYTYDAAMRLASVVVDGATVEASTYDKAGNRVAITNQTSTLSARYDARNRLEQLAGVTYQYEPIGTLARTAVGGAVVQFDFDDLGALRGVVLPDGKRIEYKIDGSGLRIGKMVGGQLVDGYLYRPDGPLVAQLDGTGQIVARFAYDDHGRLVSMERGGKSYVIVTDQVGSPRLVIDSASGEVAQAVEYDAWGRVVADSSPGFQPFGFAGGLRDLDTGLVHFGARDYDPTAGRWIQPDPIRFASGDADLYVYSGNDPVNRADPTGLQSGTNPPHVEIGCVDEPDFCWIKNIDRHEVTRDLPPGSKFWFCEEGVCYICSSGAASQSECDSEAEADKPPPQPPPPRSFEATPHGPGTNGGACLLALYCNQSPGVYTCIGVCSPPGGGVCVGYCSMGDPHVRTADRLDVSFQGAGEYLMIASADGSVAVQARQEQPGAVTSVTITTALAASVAGDRVGVYLDDEVALKVNGTAVPGTDVLLGLPNGGSVTRHGTSFVVEWPDGSRLTIDRRGEHLDYGFVPDSAIAPTLTGLMGTPNGDVGDDLVSRDGSIILSPTNPDFFAQLHGPFGDSWRISQDESLFDYAPGESTATFTLPDIPHAPATTDALDPAARAAADELCRAVGVTGEPTLSDCIVDVGLTGDPSYAASAAAVQAATAAAPPASGAIPQPIAIGNNVAGTIISPDQTDEYTFSAAAGQAVYLEALVECASDLSWRLLGPGGKSLSQEFVCNDIGRQELTEAGDYTIDIFAPTGSVATGPYAFALLPATTSVPSSVTFGQPVNGGIAQVGDEPRYTFEAAAGQTVYLDAQGLCIGGIRWRLLDPAGAPLASDAVCTDIGRQTLAAAGTYTIEIFTAAAVTGPFAFALFNVPLPRESAISLGTTVSDEITAVGEQHRYTFDASAGQVVVLHATGACVDGLEWRLLDPAGVALGSAATCYDVGLPRLSTTGRYTIEVYSPATATGPYSFELRAGP